MKPEALFINGVFESVLKEILRIQSVLPEQVLYLQPHSAHTITKLRSDPPTIDDPMRLFMSTTTDLTNISYTAEIVGWNDKRTLTKSKRRILNEIIAALQPGEGDLYNLSKTQDGESVNLLFVRRLERVAVPFSVAELKKTSNGEPLSTARTTAGGWSYVMHSRAG